MEKELDLQEKEVMIKAFADSLSAHTNSVQDVVSVLEAVSKCFSWLVDQRYEHSENVLYEVNRLQGVIEENEAKGGGADVRLFKGMAKSSVAAFILSNQYREGIVPVLNMKEDIDRILGYEV